MIENLCYHCFQYKPEGVDKCPNCGYDPAVDAGKHPLALPCGTVVGGKYTLGHVLGQGGFGITYVAQDYQTKERVAIKEFFPDTMVTRTEQKTVSSYSGQREENFTYGKACFLSEAETLAEFIGNPHIVRVFTYFEENGTAYFSMEFVDGCSLQHYAKSIGAKLSWDTVKKFIYPIMDALSAVHAKGIIHRDVTPDNIYVLKDGTTKLLDFGAARYSLGEKSRSLDVIIKHGFAPMEQYTRRGRQGPYTDVYSLAATMYFVMSGRLPQDSIDRLEEDNLADLSTLGVSIPEGVEDAIMKAMSLRHGDRYQTMAEFKAALEAGDTGEETVTPAKPVETPKPVLQKETTVPVSQPIPQEPAPSAPKHDPSYEPKLRFGDEDEDRSKPRTNANAVMSNYSNMYDGNNVPTARVQPPIKNRSSIHPLAIIGVVSLCLMGSAIIIPTASGYMKRVQEVKNQATSAQAETQPKTQPTTKVTQPPTEPTTEAPLDDDPLTIVCWYDSFLQNMFDVYNETYPNAQVEYKNCGTLGTEASAQYYSLINSGEDVDLYIAESGWLQYYLNDNTVSAPLSRIGINESDYKDAYPYTLVYGKNTNGQLRAAVCEVEVGGYCYNTEIATEYLGIETPEEMQQKISDWDGFWNTAEQLRKASGGSITMVASIRDVWNSYSCLSGPMLIENNTLFNFDVLTPFINSMKKAINKGYVDPKIMPWTTEWSDIGLNQKTMGYFYANWNLGLGAQLEQNGGNAGNWRIVAGPQEFFWGGYWFCLAPHCNSPKEAERFLRFFTCDDKTMEQYALYSGGMVNNHKAMQRIVINECNSNPLLGGQDQFVVLDDVAMNIQLKNSDINMHDQGLKDTFYSAFIENYNGTEYDILKAYSEKANGN